MSSAIAIDFGTSNTVISRWNPITQQPETLNIPNLSIQQSLNPPLIPSLLYIEDASQGKVLVGQQVRDRGYNIKTDARFFHSFKRGIGINIPAFLPELDGQIVNFEQVGQLFLSEIINQLVALQGDLDSLILTVPVDSFEAYRHWLGKVCETLPVEKVRMLDEPTAAALGYGLADKEIILVIDFGGGTLDLSIVRLDTSTPTTKPVGFLLKWGNKSLGETSRQKTKTARVLGKVGQNLGGTDIDNWLVDYFAQQGLPINPLITRLAEKLKIQLSTQQEASEVYFDEENFETHELHLNRETLDHILEKQGFFQQLNESMNSLLQQARRQGIESSDINAVLLVGGTVQLPTVQKWVEQYFTPAQIRCQRPFEAIAQGALQLAQGIEIQDFLYHSYGIRYWNRRHQSHSWHPIIKAGESYPMTQPVELVLGASVENQPSIELIIGELAADTDTTEVYFDGNRLITRLGTEDATIVQPLNDKPGSQTIAQLTPPGYPGSDRIKILFQVDEQRYLRITVEDLLTNNTLFENQLVAQLS